MIVLDTQAWLWWVHNPLKLSASALRVITEAEKSDGLRVSAISVWEIAVKASLGKLELSMDIDEWYRQACSYPNLVVEPLNAKDLISSTQLPGSFHRDPADRIIVALARRYGSALVTSDRLIRAYPHVTTVW